MKNLSKTEKENIVKRCLSGEGITVLANEYGISRDSIYNWINEFKMQKKVKVNIGEFRKLSQKCEKLEKIIKLLQESPFINEVPHSELLPYLEQLNKKNENIHVICPDFAT